MTKFNSVYCEWGSVVKACQWSLLWPTRECTLIYFSCRHGCTYTGAD